MLHDLFTDNDYFVCFTIATGNSKAKNSQSSAPASQSQGIPNQLNLPIML